jgi:four helix bundle protein
MGYQNFKDLRAWQGTKELSVKIYTLTSARKFIKGFGLKEQLQRASISIPSNIAEGYERNSHKDFIRFLLIAKGSLSELRTQLEMAYEIGYIKKNTFESSDEECKKLGAMMTNLIKARRKNAGN